MKKKDQHQQKERHQDCINCPVDTESKLKIHKMFKRRPGRLLAPYVFLIYVFCPGVMSIDVFQKLSTLIQYCNRELLRAGSAQANINQVTYQQI